MYWRYWRAAVPPRRRFGRMKRTDLNISLTAPDREYAGSTRGGEDRLGQPLPAALIKHNRSGAARAALSPLERGVETLLPQSPCERYILASALSSSMRHCAKNCSVLWQISHQVGNPEHQRRTAGTAHTSGCWPEREPSRGTSQKAARSR